MSGIRGERRRRLSGLACDLRTYAGTRDQKNMLGWLQYKEAKQKASRAESLARRCEAITVRVAGSVCEACGLDDLPSDRGVSCVRSSARFMYFAGNPTALRYLLSLVVFQRDALSGGWSDGSRAALPTFKRTIANIQQAITASGYSGS